MHNESTEPTRSRRAPIDERMIFKPVRRQNAVGHLVNVSTSGAYILGREPLLRDSEVILYLPIKIGTKKSVCILSGTVVRVAQEGEDYGHGICFKHNLTPKQRDMLECFVEFRITGKLVRKPKALQSARPNQEEIPPREERRENTRIGRDLTREKQPKQLKETSAAQAMQRASVFMRSMKWAAMISMVLSIFVYQQWSERKLIREVQSFVALSDVSIQNETLRGTIDPIWNATHDINEQRSRYEGLARTLETFKMNGAVLVAEDGREMAQILRSSDGILIVRLSI